MSTADQTINIPQLLLIIILGGLAVRYFFFSSSTSTLPAHARGSSGARAREADIERIQQMFPQVERRSIMWDLQRNGGNVVATTERILSGRGLEVPPQSFQPPLPSTATGTTTTANTAPSNPKPLHPDLITRYNLQSRLSPDQQQQQQPPSSSSSSSQSQSQPQDLAKEEEVQKTPTPPPQSLSPAQQRKSWSANKVERQALLQKRRDEMILAARRKMEARLAEERGVMS